MDLIKNRGFRKFAIISILSVIAIAAVSAVLMSSSKKSGKTVIIKEENRAPVVKKFGLPVDSFTVVEDVIGRNEFLSDILSAFNIDNATVLKLAQKAKDIYSVRNLAAGKPYSVFCSKDSANTAQYFIYQPDAVNYVVYDLRDSLNVYRGQRAVTTKTVSLSGTINSSLYETMDEAGGDPGLAVKLAHIFAWSIDFYRIRKGDWFKVLYDQQYVKGEPIESGSIRSAVFSHDGEIYSAYYFQPDSTKEGEYYNEEGKSLRKAFLKAPLKFSHITSRYTLRRFHPVQKRWKAHLGTDYAAPTGTPIIATANGTVIESRYTRFNGNYVKIRHNNSYTTQYLHMSRRAVKPGQSVSQGQVIGYVGSTGLATGPHVCYRFWKNGKQVDPLREKFPSATPVSDQYISAFKQQVNAEKILMDSLRSENNSTR